VVVHHFPSLLYYTISYYRRAEASYKAGKANKAITKECHHQRERSHHHKQYARKGGTQQTGIWTTTTWTGPTTTSNRQGKGNTTKGTGATTEETEKAKEDNPNMTKMVLEYFRQTKPSYEKDFFNTTTQLNRNYPARPHVDKNNHGPSYIIALGEYEGGRQWC